MPTPQIKKKFSFTQALEEALIGKKITRTDWGTVEAYGLIRDEKLMLFRDGKFFDWIVSKADLTAEDWLSFT